MNLTYFHTVAEQQLFEIFENRLDIAIWSIWEKKCIPYNWHQHNTPNNNLHFVIRTVKKIKFHMQKAFSSK